MSDQWQYYQPMPSRAHRDIPPDFTWCYPEIKIGGLNQYKECNVQNNGNDAHCLNNWDVWEGKKCVCPTGWDHSGNVLRCGVQPTKENI